MSVNFVEEFAYSGVKTHLLTEIRIFQKAKCPFTQHARLKKMHVLLRKLTLWGCWPTAPPPPPPPRSAALDLNLARRITNMIGIEQQQQQQQQQKQS